MKRCPQCRRDYYDDTLSFCLEDGAELVYGVREGEPATAILHDTAPSNEARTRAQIHTTASPSDSGHPSQKQNFSARRSVKPLVASIIAILVLVAVFFGYRYFATGAGTINSIAVLPFTNASGEKETEFLSDGLAETLINNFTKIPDLKVAARSSAFRFRGREGEPKEIGRELGVGSVLTGRLLQRGDTVSIQVDLVNTSDGLQIWGNKYEGKASDIVGIQQQIATDVSQQLKSKLTGAQVQQIAKTYTQNSEAYQHYLRGRYYWNKRTGDNLRLAIAEFQQAAENDPNYALAFVGLADSHALLKEYAGVPTSESLPQARAFAEKALALDPNIAEVYASLGTINQMLWNWDESEAAFKRAVELNPNYPTTYHWYSIMLAYTGRRERSYEMIRKAAELDPLSLVIRSKLSEELRDRGDFEASLKECRTIQELDPNFVYVHQCFGAAYLFLGRLDESIVEYRKFDNADYGGGGATPDLGVALARAGHLDEARDHVRRLEVLFAKGRPNAVGVASVYFALGEKDTGFEWLEKAFATRDSGLPDVLSDRSSRSLEGDPRYESLLKRVGLKQEK